MELKSKIDKSVNIIEENLKGFIESRYVRRCDEYFNCYLSSQSGCNKGCKFCHLTATGQTAFEDVPLHGYLDQAIQVFKQYKKSNITAKRVHYSFMARGEPLSNLNLLRDADQILIELGYLASKYDLNPKFNISTIMPSSLHNVRLTDIFKTITPTIYYSLYSTNPEFRKKWMPAAMEVDKALNLLKEYQDMTKKIIKIHFPFIKGENDSEQDVYNVCDKIRDRNLLVEFNLVRYNPFSPEQGEEASPEILERNFNIINDAIAGKAKVIQRVGQDCFSSCGQFYKGTEKEGQQE